MASHAKPYTSSLLFGVFNFSRALFGQRRLAFKKYLSEFSLCMIAFFSPWLLTEVLFYVARFSPLAFLSGGLLLRAPSCFLLPFPSST